MEAERYRPRPCRFKPFPVVAARWRGLRSFPSPKLGNPDATNVSTLMEEPNGPIAIFSAMSSTRTVDHSEFIAKPPRHA